ncbi:transcription factor IIIB 50 kDa subunit [Antrostomus carolinensis]|uniref:transcription factor IIIB 50 kDa subunit n=1 Tax=Antrostomus carolinensis TaxID=279965 RepID=UPI000528E115|nr:transcription factor IIIB 50 kDa subunit [Antrostomus carolinensis]
MVRGDPSKMIKGVEMIKMIKTKMMKGVEMIKMIKMIKTKMMMDVPRDLPVLIIQIQYHGHLVAQNLSGSIPQSHREVLWPDTDCFSEVAYSQSTGQKEQLSRCLQRGIRRVQDLCKVLQLPTVFEETAVSYFQRALQHPSFHLVSLERKELLGGCCVFVTCRQHNWPLTMGTICSLLYAKQDLFASVYLSLQKELELSVPALSLADLVKTHLNSFRLFQHAADIPAPFVEDKEKMITRTMQIVELASETWLVTENAFCLEDEEEQRPAALAEGSPGSAPAAGGAEQEKDCPSKGKHQRGGSPRPLLPPCLINPRKRLRTAAPSASDSAVTGDEPISDSEIEQYLRGPEEIQAFRKAKAWP